GGSLRSGAASVGGVVESHRDDRLARREGILLDPVGVLGTQQLLHVIIDVVGTALEGDVADVVHHLGEFNIRGGGDQPLFILRRDLLGVIHHGDIEIGEGGLGGCQGGGGEEQ